MAENESKIFVAEKLATMTVDDMMQAIDRLGKVDPDALARLRWMVRAEQKKRSEAQAMLLTLQDMCRKGDAITL